MKTPLDFGAKSADDTALLRAWLDAIAGGHGAGAEGTFNVGGPLGVWPGTTIHAGREFVLRKAPAFPPGAFMLTNPTWESDSGTYRDANISIGSLTLDGASQTPGADGLVAPLVAMVGVDGLTFDGTKFQNCSDPFALTNCRRVMVRGIEGERWGLPGSSFGFAWFSPDCDLVSIIDTLIHDGGSGWMVHCKRLTAINNRAENISDVMWYGYVQGATIIGSKAKGIRYGAGPCGAFELAGSGIYVMRSEIEDCDGAAMIVENIKNGAFMHNTCTKIGQRPDLPSMQLTPMVWLLSYEQRALSFNGANKANPFVENFVVAQNTLDNAGGKCPRAISVDLAGGIPSTLNGPPMRNVIIEPNTLIGKWSQGDIVIGPGTGVSLSKRAISRKPRSLA